MDRLLAGLTSRQITEWMAYAELEPFGPLADDRRAGVIAAALTNTAFGRSKGAKTYVPADFFSSLRPARSRDQPWQRMADGMKGFTAALGGRVVSMSVARAAAASQAAGGQSPAGQATASTSNPPTSRG